MAEKDIRLEDVGEILQHLYDSEINLETGWFWDGGFDYGFGPNQEGAAVPITHTTLTNIAEAIHLVAVDAARKYPESDFAAWWRGFRS